MAHGNRILTEFRQLREDLGPIDSADCGARKERFLDLVSASFALKVGQQCRRIEDAARRRSYPFLRSRAASARRSAISSSARDRFGAR